MRVIQPQRSLPTSRKLEIPTREVDEPLPLGSGSSFLQQSGTICSGPGPPCTIGALLASSYDSRCSRFIFSGGGLACETRCVEDSRHTAATCSSASFGKRPRKISGRRCLLVPHQHHCWRGNHGGRVGAGACSFPGDRSLARAPDESWLALSPSRRPHRLSLGLAAGGARHRW